MIYLDDAATSRHKPFCVRKAVKKSLRHAANPGRGSHKDAIRGAMIVEEARERLADSVNAKHANVIFTKNCTEALNLAILGTARLGGHVVTTVLEHNSVLRPLSMLRKEGLISMTVVKGERGVIRAKDILAAINEKTYLVAVSAMSNVTGFAPPLLEIGEIASDHGVKLLVDGAQGIGHIPIDFDKIGIDLLAGAGHKALHGIMGSGFLIYNKNTFVNPLMYGGTGTESMNLTQPTLPPESLESGTLNLPGIAALSEGTEWTMLRFEKINRKISEISHYLHRGIVNLGIETFSVAGSPLVTFRLPGKESSEIADLLNGEFGIALRAGLHCAPLIHQTLGTEKTGLLRASIGCHNTIRDAEKLIRALKALQSTR